MALSVSGSTPVPADLEFQVFDLCTREGFHTLTTTYNHTRLCNDALFQCGGDKPDKDDDDPYAHSDEETEDEAKAQSACLAKRETGKT